MPRRLITACLVLLVSTLSWSTARAESPLVAVEVSPPDVQLTTSRDRQSLIVQARYEDGITRDVTADATFALVNPELAKLDGRTLFPVVNGETQLNVEFGGRTIVVPVTVAQAEADRPISFQLDVMPVFMKSGCNNGSCHGAARGKDGFRLSLFGFDPRGDHFRLTREEATRRINRAIPEESLVLTKAIGEVSHTGGDRFDADSEYYATLLRWLKSGAPDDQGEIPKVLSVELYPKNAVLDGEGAAQQLTVRAQYSDGTNRDVTSLAYFSTSNDNSAGVTQEGVVTAAARGEAFVMARFDTHTVGSQFITLPKGLEFAWPNPPENNYVDEFVHAKLRKLRIVPSELCSDEEFLRRVTIDVVGMLPTPEEYTAFLSDTDPNKREKLVDELLERKEFVELWVMKWAELLQVRTVQNRVDYKAMLRYYEWLQERIANEMPTDQMVRELLSANGSNFSNAATNYFQAEQDTLKVSENVAQVFMGMRIQCTQCHNHPFDRWTMDDYYGFAAFFAQVGRKRGEDPRETIVYNRGSGEVKHPVGGQNVEPKFLGGEVPDVKGKDRREVLANWLASPDNPYFAENLANIVWAHFLGQGIVDEVDDVRISNPASNPELLAELGQRFTGYGYDFKKLVRDICTSRTYQLATRTNETNESDTRNFSHASLRRLRAEVLLDAISQATDTSDKFRGLPAGARAVQISDGNTSTYFLTTFGRAKRETVCSCEVVMEPNLSQALHLLNGSTVQGKIQQGGLLDRRLKEGVAPLAILEELYVRTLTRKPTEKERTTLAAILAESKDDPKPILEDVYWSLLNSREFLFNH
jgi:hypothetical protein